MDIERALKNGYSADAHKRDLRHEAKAHITVQKWIDEGGLNGARACTAEGIQEVHRRFCELVPDDLLWVEDPSTREHNRVVPGELRGRDVQVGCLIAISLGAVPRFLQRSGQVLSGLGKTESILAVAAAHHRLLWIHPFLDHNGRVARPMSHAMLLSTLEAAVVEGDKTYLPGVTPCYEDLMELVGLLQSELLNSVVIGSLKDRFPIAERIEAKASGMIALRIEREPVTYVLFFRPEVAQTVLWGGDPEKPVSPSEDGLRLSPRKSFEKWKEEVSGHSLPWSKSEVRVAQELR